MQTPTDDVIEILDRIGSEVFSRHQSVADIDRLLEVLEASAARRDAAFRQRLQDRPLTHADVVQIHTWLRYVTGVLDKQLQDPGGCARLPDELCTALDELTCIAI